MNAHMIYDVLVCIAGEGMLTSELCRSLPDEIFLDPGFARAVAESAAMLGFRAVRAAARETVAPLEQKVLPHRRADTETKRDNDPFDFPKEVETDFWEGEDEEEGETLWCIEGGAPDDTWVDAVSQSFSPAVAQYFREIRRFRVFTRNEEREKFEEFQKLHDRLLLSPVIVWLRTRGEIPDQDEEGALQWGVIHKVFSLLNHAGRDAPDIAKETCLQWLSLYDHAEVIRNEIVRHNLRFVVTVAAKYRGKGMDFLDLIQEGNKGLMHAVDKFECARDLRFLTYATYWIRQAIRRALSEQRRTIRVPSNIDADIKKYHDAIEVFRLQHGVSPTEQELALCLEMHPLHVHAIAEAVLLDTVSLDRPIRSGEENTIASLIRDPRGVDPVEAVIAHDTPLWMKLGLASLSEKERTIIILRGHTGELAHSLDKVGDHFGFSRERARQLEKQALTKLRHYYWRYGDKDK